MNNYLIYAGAAVIAFWGVAHIIPLGKVIKGFGGTSDNMKFIFAMEWIAEGLTFIFIGTLNALFVYMFGTANPGTVLVARASAVMLAVLALVTMFTGSRSSIVPIKLCPYVKTISAVLLILGTR